MFFGGRERVHWELVGELGWVRFTGTQIQVSKLEEHLDDLVDLKIESFLSNEQHFKYSLYYCITLTKCSRIFASAISPDSINELR